MPPHPPSKTPTMKIPPDTELIGVSFRLQPLENVTLFPQYTTALHGWFLDRIRQDDPALSRILHDEQDEKAFTLSPLDGLIESAGDKIELHTSNTYTWTLTLFSHPVVEWAQKWLQKSLKTIDLRHASLTVQSIFISLAPTTYQNLWQPANGHSIALTFLSPTSFRRKGYHFPLPLPLNVFQSYLRRWNTFSQPIIEADPFLAWVDDNVIITRHQLRSSKVSAGKKGAVTGFTGAIEYGVTREAAHRPDYLQTLFSLARLAPYCGTGHKTTFGLGQTRLGWTFPDEDRPVPTMQTSLAERIDRLTEQLMSLQKRTGGDRAARSCQIKATILARREFGESLQDIARDLEMPYETVKTYAKLTRRILRGEK
jgi:CRISPR-associated endoribonuclease Cas6